VFGLLQVHCHSSIIIGRADGESIKGDLAEKFFDAAKFRAPLRATDFENQIRDQLHACNYSHEKCPKREKAELPTRVIRLGKNSLISGIDRNRCQNRKVSIVSMIVSIP
jgi:hypothetical protein